MITFKSAPAFFEKEKDGRKPNTFRKDDPNDARFQRLNEKRWLEQPTRIRIINTETGETFIRTINATRYAATAARITGYTPVTAARAAAVH